MKYDIRHLEAWRTRLREEMPQVMKDFEVEQKSQKLPSKEGLNKREYLRKIAELMEGNCFDERYYELNFKHSYAKFMKYSYQQIDTALLWMFYNFAELDLGDGRWFSFWLDNLKLMVKKEWDFPKKDLLIYNHLRKTRWAYESGLDSPGKFFSILPQEKCT